MKGFLKAAFPFIAAAASAGGPFGTLAAAAVGKALGIDKVPPTTEGISDAIATQTAKDPEATLKLQQAEHEFQLQMQQMGFESAEKLEEIAAADRASARSREIAVKDSTPAYMAAGVTLGFFTLLAIIAFRPLPETAENILLMMVGALANAWGSIVSYYFGSSAGSAQKTEIMAQQGK